MPALKGSLRKPRGKKENKVIQDREEQAEADGQNKQLTFGKTKLDSKTKDPVDIQGAWIKKTGKLRFKYKKHIASDIPGLGRDCQVV